ncbi:MAG: glycosyltransferase [Bacteroidetes bacterium]|nr:glycosyltransferase [Bacteroidota bacterium]MCL5025465.1 glycosyltransferase [Chloroflexota bacterium]
MRILFLTPQSPYPPNKGTATRNYNLIVNVAARHEVHLLTFADAGLEGGGEAHVAAAEGSLLPQADLDHLRRYCAAVEAVPVPRRSAARRLAAALLSPTPDLALRLASAELDRRLASALERTPFDLVQVEGLEMAPHWLGLEAASAGQISGFPRVVLDAHNAEYLLQQRAFTNDLRRPRKWPGAAYSLLQWPKLRHYEARACRLAAGVVAVSENDRRALAAIAPGRPMAVVPNGVDTAYFRPSGTPREPNALVFTGTMDFRPNVDAVLWFCQQVFPRIHAQVPDCTFYIVGQRPKPEVRRLAGMPGVEVTGSVDDVRPYLWRAALCVVPLRVGGGTRFKILEAMACGTPVVSTTLGAEGIALTAGVHAALADTPQDLAGAVVALLREPERAAAMAERGQAFAAANYGWKVLAGRLLAFYQELRQ